MDTLRITKIFRFESAHALEGYDGKCKHIHGHSYILHVTIKGTQFPDESRPTDRGMIMDFTDLKKLVEKAVLDRFDHSLVLQKGSPLSGELTEEYGNVVIVPFRPTSENLISYFADCIQTELVKSDLRINGHLHSLRLYETATSYAEWFYDDNHHE